MEREPTTSIQLASNPFSLSFLFYLVTLGAILSACLRPLSEVENVSFKPLAIMIVAGAFFGAIFGFGVGLISFRKWLVAFAGGGICLLLGGAAGALTLIPPSRFWSVMTLALVGCWILILIMMTSVRYREFH